MKASIIVPTKNGGKLFEKVLQKILDQNLEGEDFEVIIIDSGSKDTTIKFICELQKVYKDIILKEIPPEDFGHGKTRNFGASLAKGEFLVFLTQDALPCDTYWLKNLLGPFDMDRDIAGVFGKHLPYDDCDIFEAYNINMHFKNFGDTITIYHLDDKERYEKDERYRHLLCFYSDNSSAMRRSVWEKIPYPDVDFAEDQLWAKQIIESGYKKAYTPCSVVYHSHRYSVCNQFMRYYDEIKGLNKIYNFVPVKNILFLPLYIFKHWLNDLRFLKNFSHMSVRSKIRWAYYSIFKNIVRYTAAYLGVKGNKIELLDMLLSREVRIRRIKG